MFVIIHNSIINCEQIHLHTCKYFKQLGEANFTSVTYVCNLSFVQSGAFPANGYSEVLSCYQPCHMVEQ